METLTELGKEKHNWQLFFCDSKYMNLYVKD